MKEGKLVTAQIGDQYFGIKSMKPEEELFLFVEESFSLDYNTKAWWIKD